MANSKSKQKRVRMQRKIAAKQRTDRKKIVIAQKKKAAAAGK
jgi:hypothetical protein